jgi:hypothetical protein
MRIFLSLMFCGLLTVFTGCIAVNSENLIGFSPVELDADDWEGIWYEGETVVFIKVKDREKGILRVGTVDDKDDNLVLKQFDVYLRKGKKAIFGNIPYKQIAEEDLDKLEENSYSWFLVRHDAKKLNLIFPNGDTLKKLLDVGKVKGEKTKNSLVLKGTSEELTEFFEPSEDNSMFYYWKESSHFIRLTK